jgi:signal transduction histidine kinase
MTARDAARGMPIAAHLGLLVALAFVSAFVGVFAVVIWLPPRPPDVMRADMVAEHFQAGYRFAAADGHTLPNDNMEWSLGDAPPANNLHEPDLEITRAELADKLDLRPDQIRIAAANIDRRTETYVIRMQDTERHITVHGQSIILRTPMPMTPVATPDAPEAPEAPQPPETPEAFAPPGTPAPTHFREEVRVDTPDVSVSVPAPPPAPAPPRPQRPHPARPAPAPAGQPAPLWIPTPPGTALISGFEFAAELPDGRWLSMRQGRNWAEFNWLTRAGLIIGGALAVLALLALLFARQLARPIQHFADTVQAVGVDPQSASVTEEGPSELRGAARAVNTMQSRLRALIADRTKTLAAVAHDMRTPLMRLRLSAENAPAELRDKMAKEIGEVEALVASFIAFARDDPAEEARVRLDLSALLQSLADDHVAAGRKVAFSGEEREIITGQSLGLKRLFGNLVDNALKHGGDARIHLARGDGFVVVDVQDDGPGIPAEQRESVFEPFVRLNEGASGAGLGLAAARSIARAHGGDVVIAESEKGALLRVTLPA